MYLEAGNSFRLVLNSAFLKCFLVSYKAIVHKTSLVAMGLSSTRHIVHIYAWYQVILSIIGII